MAISEDNLEKFIKTILDTQNVEKTKAYSQSELKKVAFEMGFTQEDWEQYLAAFDQHITRGKGFLNHGNWNDAIVEFENAHHLNPYNLIALYYLAFCHKQRYLVKKKRSDRERAIELAERCLQRDANHSPSYKLISDLKKKKRVPGTIFWVILIIGFLVILVIFLSQRNQPEKITEDSPTQTTNNENTPRGVTEIEEEAEPDVPVVFVKNQKSEGLNFILSKSVVNDYNSSYSYNLLGYLKLDKIEVDELKMKVQVIGKQGKVLISDFIEPAQSYWPPYRSGDLIAVDYLEYVKDQKAPTIEKVKLSVQTIVKAEAPANYEPSPKANYQWGYDRPPNYNVEIRERLKTISGSFNNDRMNFQLVLEAENTGNTSINTLQIEIEWYDKHNELVLSKTAYFCTSSKPAIKRGQTRIYSGTWAVPISKNQFKNYKIVISNIK